MVDDTKLRSLLSYAIVGNVDWSEEEVHYEGLMGDFKYRLTQMGLDIVSLTDVSGSPLQATVDRLSAELVAKDALILANARIPSVLVPSGTQVIIQAA